MIAPSPRPPAPITQGIHHKWPCHGRQEPRATALAALLPILMVGISFGGPAAAPSETRDNPQPAGMALPGGPQGGGMISQGPDGQPPGGSAGRVEVSASTSPDSRVVLGASASPSYVLTSFTFACSGEVYGSEVGWSLGQPLADGIVEGPNNQWTDGFWSYPSQPSPAELKAVWWILY